MALQATRIRGRAAVAPWVPGALLATALGCVYVITAPASADLAAADYRSALFSREGLSLWDNGWYAGHHLPGYSVLSPALGALLSPRLVGALSLVAATALFGVLVVRAVERDGARYAGAVFAVGMTGELLAGRIPFALGVACGMTALLGMAGARVGATFVLALLTSLASPVAGFFLALIGAAQLVTGASDARLDGGRARAPAVALALIAGAALPVLVLVVAFPEGGYEPFGFPDLWPELLLTVVVAAILGAAGGGRRRRAWLVGAGVYGLACVAAFAVRSPLGANVTRLGPLVGVPLVVATLVARHRWWAAVAAAVGLAWALFTPIGDLALVQGDPSVQAKYYRPLLAELSARARGAPLRVEIPLTGAHWEAARVPGQFALARGWERQLDTRDAPLFYARRLSAAAYRAWLQANAVAYVALPDVRLDYSSRAEARLIDSGLPYLAPVWASRHWRLFAVQAPAGLVTAPGVMRALQSTGFSFFAPRSGIYTVAVRFTPYWKLIAGRGCVAQSAGGWTRVEAPAAGEVRVGVSFSLARLLSHGPRCR